LFNRLVSGIEKRVP